MQINFLFNLYLTSLLFTGVMLGGPIPQRTQSAREQLLPNTGEGAQP